MIQVAWIRIGLALGAMVLFAIGVRTGDDNLRWVAIALLAVALLLRLAGRQKLYERRPQPASFSASCLPCPSFSAPLAPWTLFAQPSRTARTPFTSAHSATTLVMRARSFRWMR